MTNLTGDLRSIMGTPFGGVGHAVLIFSRVTRAAFDSDSVILQLHDRIDMPEDAQGKFRVDGLDPGPVRVELEGGTVHNHGWNIDLPDEGTWSLADLVDAQVDWSPAVIGRAEAAARDSRDHADRAEAAADRVGTAEQVSVWAGEASGAADAAAQSEANAKQSELAASGYADNADGHASRAESAADTAAGETSALVRSEFEGLLSGAESARDAAGVSETNAAQSENDAAGYADFAEQYKTAAELAKNDAAQSKADAALSASSADSDAGAAAASASSAAQSESSAATHAQSALTYAAQSEDARDESRLARDVAEGHANRAATSESNAKTSETNAKQYEDNAGDYAAVATTAATEAVDAMERATEIAGGDFATRDYVNQKVSSVTLTGTGFPEGNVAAPVGAVYTDSAATNGAIRWIKTRGTGSTGWEVEWGDTGWRNITADIMNGWKASGVHIRRVGRLVQFRAYLLDGRDATSGTFVQFPTGFGNLGAGWHLPLTQGDTLVVTGTRNAILTSGKLYFNGGYHTSSSVIVSDSWPTTLPGTPN